MKSNYAKKIKPDEIRPYDLLWWDAKQMGSHKRRPFLVTRTSPSMITALPITHGKPSEGLFKRFNVKATFNVNTAINYMTGENGQNYLKPANRVNVKISTFKRKQYPERAGNLMEFVSRNEIKTQEKSLHKEVQTIKHAWNEWIKERANGQKFDYQDYRKRSAKKKVLSTSDFSKFLLSESEGLDPTQKFTYQPVNTEAAWHRKHDNYKMRRPKQKHNNHKKIVMSIDDML